MSLTDERRRGGELDHGDDPITLEEIAESLRRHPALVLIIGRMRRTWRPNFVPPPGGPDIHDAVRRWIDEG